MAQGIHPAFTVLIACVPAALVMWWGRDLSRNLDDPALPERLLANRRRTGAAFGVSMGLLIMTGVGRLAWSLPLLVLTRMAAAYPLRKVLYDETWGFIAYLSFFVRLLVAVFGFWIFVAVIPAVTLGAGPGHWIVAAALGAIALAWNTWYSTLLSSVLRATPVTSPALTSRFAQLVKACGLPDVRFEQVNLRGGVFANAVALPSMRRPAVLVTDTVMSRFDEDEITAILAHELAHHEHYNRRRLRNTGLMTALLIAVAALLAPVVRTTAPHAATAVLLIWPVCLIVAMVLRAQHLQKHETESDLRAVALTGDGEALVRALTKLHVFARVPRRWESEFERRATHPSLARRIQAIRQASGVEPMAIEPSTFTSAGNGGSVTFRDDRLEWAEGTSTTHTIAYGHLAELRIDAGTSTAPKLVAIDAGKRRWELALQSADIARVQSLLDIVDVRLGKVAAAPARVAISAVRLLASLAIAMGLLASQTAVFIAGLVAVVRPTPQLASAAGVAALTGAALTFSEQALRQSGVYAWFALALGLCGAALMAVAFANRNEAGDPSFAKQIAPLAVCAGLAWTVILMSASSAFRLYRTAHEWPSAIVLTLACAGALMFAPSRKTRMTALPVALGALVAAYLGSPKFVDRFVDDPFVAPASAVSTTSLPRSPISEFPIELEPAILWISPSGRYVAFSSEDEREQLTIHAGLAGGRLADVAADEAVFIDESRLLLLERQSRASTLRVIDLAAGNHEQWTLSVPVSWPLLSIDRRSQTWRLVGRGADGNFAGAEGRIGDSAVQHTEWKSPPAANDAEILSVSRGAVLALENHSRRSLMPTAIALMWVPFLRPTFHLDSRLWTVRANQLPRFIESDVDLSCRSSVIVDDPATCAAFDGTRTRFFTVDPGVERPTPVASLDGRLYPHGNNDRGWVAGWWESSTVLVHSATGEVIRPAAGGGTDVPLHQLAVGETVIAATAWNGDTWTVRIYPKP